MNPDSDIRVWRFLLPDGGFAGGHLVELPDGGAAVVPRRLYFQVSPDATSETRHAQVSETNHVEDQDGEVWEWTAYGNQSFEIGRQVVVDALVSDEGTVEVKAMTVFRPDGGLSSKDATRGIRLQDWTRMALEQFARLEIEEPPGVTRNVDGLRPLTPTEVAERVRARRPSKPGPRGILGDNPQKRQELINYCVKQRSKTPPVSYMLIARDVEKEYGLDHRPSESTIHAWVKQARRLTPEVRETEQEETE